MSVQDEKQGRNVPEWTKEYSLKKDCPALGTNLCWRYAQGGCETCYVGSLKGTDAKMDACERWDKTVALVPPDIDDYSDSTVCQLCTGEDKEEADGYAAIDMANPEPYSTKGMFFGMGKKVRSPVGSLLTVHIAVGPKCRKAFRTVELLQVLTPIAFLVVAFILLLIPEISQPMMRAFVLLPVIFMALMVFGGLYLGRNLSLAYMRKYQDSVDFDLARVPILAKMLTRDWYFFQVSQGMPRITFRKERDFRDIFPPKDGDGEGEESVEEDPADAPKQLEKA